MTKLSSSLPKEYEDDGLSSINRELVEHPSDTHVVVAIIDCKQITTDTDTGMQVATARILHIEPLHDEGAADAAREMLARAKERRTNQPALPMEQVDRDTGEISLAHASGVINFKSGR